MSRAGSAAGAAVLSAEARAHIEHLRERYPHPRSAILPSLWAVQDELGFLAPEGMAEVAQLLDVTANEVQAVSTFYSMYFSRPAGRHHILVCINAACALRGADETAAYIEHRLGVPSGSTTADGIFTWQRTIECLGGCGGAPMMQVDHHFHENLTPARIDGILERVARQPSLHSDAGSAAELIPAPDKVQPHVGAVAGSEAPPGPPPLVAGTAATFTEQLAPDAEAGPQAAPRDAGRPAGGEETPRPKRRRGPRRRPDSPGAQ